MGHTFTKHLYHVVFSTKERRSLLTAVVRERLFPYLAGVTRKTGGKLLAANGTRDHVHLLVVVRADAAVSRVVGTVKANSSRWLSQTFAELQPFAWQAGYSSFTVSESSRARVLRYIENQREHHRRFAYADELMELLGRHGVTFDQDHYLD